jgi:hypothetical protein
MSVISFDDGEVWGASRRFVYNMLEFFIEVAGPKRHLVEFKQRYDHGYNHIPLEDVGLDELVEFRDLTAKYLASGAFVSTERSDEANEAARTYLSELIDMTDASIARRRPS